MPIGGTCSVSEPQVQIFQQIPCSLGQGWAKAESQEIGLCSPVLLETNKERENRENRRGKKEERDRVRPGRRGGQIRWATGRSMAYWNIKHQPCEHFNKLGLLNKSSLP